jgi:hypothetical protein
MTPFQYQIDSNCSFRPLPEVGVNASSFLAGSALDPSVYPSAVDIWISGDKTPGVKKVLTLPKASERPRLSAETFLQP